MTVSELIAQLETKIREGEIKVDDQVFYFDSPLNRTVDGMNIKTVIVEGIGKPRRVLMLF